MLPAGFHHSSVGKESACSAGVEKTPWEGNGNPLQYSCLENSMDRGSWQATVHGVTDWDMTEYVHAHIHTTDS